MTNESERAAFESWAGRTYGIGRHPSLPDQYAATGVQCAWSAWQARAQLITEQAKAEPVLYKLVSKGLNPVRITDYYDYMPDGKWVLDNYSITPLYDHPAPSTDRVAAQGGDELAMDERVRLALSYSINFAHANPNITKTAREHILGLCELIEALRATPADGESKP